MAPDDAAISLEDWRDRTSLQIHGVGRDHDASIIAQRKQRARVVAELELELASLEQKEGRGDSKRASELCTSSRFGKYLHKTSTGKLLLDRGAISDAERYDGKWVVTPDDEHPYYGADMRRG